MEVLIFTQYVENTTFYENVCCLTVVYVFVFQEWESTAAKHVSLFTFLEGISEMIILWRKLELK